MFKIHSLNTAYTKSIPANFGQTNPIAGNGSSINSVFGVNTNNVSEVQETDKSEKNSETDKAQKTKEAEIEKKLDDAFKKAENVKFSKDFGKNIKWLEKSNFPAIGKLNTVFKSESDLITDKLSEDFIKLMNYTSNPANASLGDIEQIIAELQNLISRANNVSSKAEKAVTIDKKLNSFAAKGGDTNKLNLEKVSEDFVNSIELAKESNIDTKSIDGKSSESSIKTTTNTEPELADDDKQKNIDEKLKAFIKFLDTGDPNTVKEKCPEYLKEDNFSETQTKLQGQEENNQSTNFFSEKKKVKNPFITTQMPLS